jgi:hypothetical protein
MSRFFDNSDSYNRSLDLAQDALGKEQQNLDREVSRARLKASKVATGFWK